MQPKVVWGIMGYQQYSTTIDIDTHVADEKYQGKLENLEKLWRLLNWEKRTILEWCRRFSIVNNSKVTANDSESEN